MYILSKNIPIINILRNNTYFITNNHQLLILFIIN